MGAPFVFAFFNTSLCVALFTIMHIICGLASYSNASSYSFAFAVILVHELVLFATALYP